MRPTLAGVLVASLILVGIVVPDTARAEDRPPNESVVERSDPLDAVSIPPITYTDRALLLTVTGPPPTTEQVSEPPPEPKPEPAQPASEAAPLLSVRDRALSKLRELGAAAWQIGVFDCIGSHESGWQSIRSRRANSNGTFDHGPFQINDIHWPLLNSLGLDPYRPEDAAVFVWRLSGNGQRFGAWSVHASCGV